MLEILVEENLWIFITAIFIFYGLYFSKIIPIRIKAVNSVSPEKRRQRQEEILAKGGVHANAVVKTIMQTGIEMRIRGIHYIQASLVLEIEYDGWIWEINNDYMIDLVNPVRVGDLLPVVVYFKTGECIILK